VYTGCTRGDIKLWEDVSQYTLLGRKWYKLDEEMGSGNGDERKRERGEGGMQVGWDISPRKMTRRGKTARDG
jgi:hypothetical protein